jgi:hypothetical protein
MTPEEKRDLYRLRAKAWYYKNKEKAKERINNWRLNNKERINARARRIYKDKIKDKSREYYLKNKDRILERVKNHREAHREEKRQRDKDYIKRNPHVARAAKANYKKSRKRATPKWLTQEHFDQIKEFHKTAIQLTKETGIEHHVDHIVPLQGKTVCGLHVPWNMRVITHIENRQKTNKLLEEL